MNWQELWQSILSMKPGIGEICLRLAVAMLVGLVIGTEREYTHRPAGMRTHTLVALGACVVSVLGELLFSQYSGLGASPDPARLGAQVITGVGFLGAGTILREGNTVKGLTTAASVWAVACLGLAAGFGYYALALAGMLFILITLTIFEYFQDRLVKSRCDRVDYALETKDLSRSLALVNSAAAQNWGNLDNFAVEATENGHRLSFRAVFKGRRRKLHLQNFFETLSSDPNTLSFGHAAQQHTQV